MKLDEISQEMEAEDAPCPVQPEYQPVLQSHTSELAVWIPKSKAHALPVLVRSLRINTRFANGT